MHTPNSTVTQALEAAILLDLTLCSSSSCCSFINISFIFSFIVNCSMRFSDFCEPLEHVIEPKEEVMGTSDW